MLPHANNSENSTKCSRERRTWAFPANKHKWLSLAMTAIIVISIQAAALALPPIAEDDFYTTPVDINLVVALPGVLGNDHDPELQPLSVDSPGFALGSNGYWVLDSDGSFTYYPDPGYIGPETFQYQATDGSLAFKPRHCHHHSWWRQQCTYRHKSRPQHCLREQPYKHSSRYSLNH